MDKGLLGIKGPTCDLCNRTLTYGYTGPMRPTLSQDNGYCYYGQHYSVQYDYKLDPPKIVGYTCEGQTYTPEEWEKVKKLKAWL